MAERDFELALARGVALPDETKRENLLQRCLVALDRDEEMPLEDEELDLLAAAGDIYLSPLDKK